MNERRSRSLVRISILGVLLVLALIASACGGESDESQAGASGSEGTVAPIDGGSLVVGVQSDATGWNTHISAPSLSPVLMVSSMLESLAILGADGAPQPWLAEKWTPNDTFTQWDVELRDGVTFQNGETFDAAAVVVNTMDGINGLVSGQIMKGLVTDAVAIAPMTVRFSVAEPWAAFPNSYLSAALSFQQAPSALIAEDKGNEKPIGTGPFEFEEWVPGDHLTVTKNATYWRPGKPHLDEITFRMMTDSNSRASALRSGDVDMMLTQNPLDAADFEAEGYTVIRDWDTQAEMIVLNTGGTAGGEPNPLNNLHARKALVYATDREAVAGQVGEGIETLTSPFSPNGPWGQPEDQNGYLGFDLEKAKQEVESYKEDTGADALIIELSVITDTEQLALAQLIQSQWTQAGIEVRIDAVEPTSAVGRVIGGDYKAAILALYNAPDPDQFHYFWSSDTIGGDGGININLQQYTTEEIDEALAIGRSEPAPATRKAAYDGIVKDLNEAAVNVWLYYTPYTLVADPRVHGLEVAAELPLANFQFKPWLGDVWVSG